MQNEPPERPGICRLPLDVLTGLLAVAALTSAASAQVPREIETQARLVDALGSNVTGPITITVLIYDAATGGTPRWSHTYPTTAQGGVINLRLGRPGEAPFPSDLFETAPLYITFQVAGEPEMSPRRELASAPFAIRSDRVDNVDRTTSFEDGTVESPAILDETVESCDVKNGSLESCDVLDETLESRDVLDETLASCDVKDESLASCDVLDESLASCDIKDGDVQSSDLAAGAVGTAALQDRAVLPAKVGGGGSPGNVLTWLDGVTGATWAPTMVSPNTVGSPEIVDGSIGSMDIGPMAVDGSHIADGSITSMDIAPMAVGSTQILDGSVSTSDIAMMAVDGARILNGTITAMDLAPMAVEGPALAPMAVGTPALADGAVTTPKIDTSLAFGQSVLKYDAGLLQWRSDGLSLPYAELSSSPGPLLELENGDTGQAILGIAGSGGVRGQVDVTPSLVSGTLGVDQGPGDDARGVEGAATAANRRNTGVYGTAESDSGLAAYGVYGSVRETPSSGSRYGVYGEDVDGDGYGVYGTSLDGDEGYGVYGYAEGHGVHGETQSPSGYGVFSEGDFGGTGAKYFVQPHPDDPSKEVRFVSLEGNESGTYFRGSGRVEDGAAVIVVPEAFRLVSEEEGLAVQLTSVGAPASLWVQSQDLERIVVRSDRDVAFHYFVNGVRRGYADFESIRDNRAYRPRVPGVPYGAQYPEGQRRLLVENGILNDDFTPNEHTAAGLGWSLREPEDARGGER